MIKFSEISISIPNRKLWHNFSLTVRLGQKIVITGPSGCGKSSLLKAAVGLMPSTGIITVDDMQLSAKNIIEIRNKLAFIGQEPLLSDGIVIDSLREPFTFKTHSQNIFSEQKREQFLDVLSLNKAILQQTVSKLSGGEKQRLCILRALLLGKKIFLLDEVTSALDHQSKVAVMNLFLDNNDYTILSVAHDKEWINACDEIKCQDITHE